MNSIIFLNETYAVEEVLPPDGSIIAPSLQSSSGRFVNNRRVTTRLACYGTIHCLMYTSLINLCSWLEYFIRFYDETLHILKSLHIAIQSLNKLKRTKSPAFIAQA